MGIQLTFFNLMHKQPFIDGHWRLDRNKANMLITQFLTPLEIQIKSMDVIASLKLLKIQLGKLSDNLIIINI